MSVAAHMPALAVFLDWLDDFETVFWGLLVWRIAIYELHYRDINVREVRMIQHPVACYMLFLIGAMINIGSAWMNVGAVLAVWVLSFLWEQIVSPPIPRKIKHPNGTRKPNRRSGDPKN